MRRTNVPVRFAVLAALCLLIVADRALWASVSQWREDQATNIWLGYTQSVSAIPVGLVSSYDIPNPNGMVLLAWVLSRLPGLLAISTVLGCAQAALIVWLCLAAFGPRRSLVLLVAAPLLASVILRASSVEFWNQWVMTLVNLSFLIWIVVYFRRPALGKIPVLVALVCVAPAIYLAGLINAIVMAVLGTAAILARPPDGWQTGWWKAAVLSLLVVAASAGLTWVPYFRAVGSGFLSGSRVDTSIPLADRWSLAAEAVWRFPYYATSQWARAQWFSILHYDAAILGRSGMQLVRLVLAIHLVQATITFAAIAVAAISAWVKARRFSWPAGWFDTGAALPIAISVAFIVLAYGLSPLLGGPRWSYNGRPDQVVQFLPFFIVFWFATPVALRLPGAARRVVTVSTWTLAGVYVVVNVACGVAIVRAHHAYRGGVLSPADVPLTTKMQVVDFIAADWRSVSSRADVPVDYSLGGGRWDVVPQVGRRLTMWYPAPMTMGRSFDYDLLRRYGLRNTQEGVQLRTVGTGRYLVSYAFLPVPVLSGTAVRHRDFGRLRVTIVER